MYNEFNKIIKRIGIAFAIIILMQVFAIILSDNNLNNVCRAETYEDFEYTINSETNSITITKYIGSATEVTIPSTIDGKSVTGIGERTFSECRSLTSINLLEGIKIIGNYAFLNCTSLTNIKIPNGVTSVERGLFLGCKNLASIDIPDSVTSIGDSAFWYCNSLTNIRIPNGVTSIGDGAFYYCSGLKNINIPHGVTSIGNETFHGCGNLISINIHEGVTQIGDYALMGCSSLRVINIPNSVTSIGEKAFFRCSSLYSINIADQNQYYKSENGILFNKSGTELIKYPEGKKDIINYNIPKGVTSIGKQTFYNCNILTSINIPDGVTSIGDYAFSECYSLTSINIPDDLTSIGNKVFYGCRLYVGRNTNEIGLPKIIKRALNENDILYSIDGFLLESCSLNQDNTKLIANDNTGISLLHVESGKLYGLELIVRKSGTIIYSRGGFTNKNILVQIILEEGETITNNDGKNYYVFEQNGEFIFEYTTKSGEQKTAKASVTNIDKEAPTITSVTGNPTSWTNNNVTLTVTASDELSGIAETNGYSFDGGETWQTENTKTYSENETGIKVQVKDNAGNITEYETINITKIDKDVPTITSVTGNPTSWTKNNVTLTVTASDELSGIAETNGYSFDGGKTWQTENTKTYSKNEVGIKVQVKDKAGNITEYETINITKIDKDAPTITSITGNPTSWTKNNVTLTVIASDELSGIAETNGYSFDGGKTWQTENTKTYSKNEAGIIIKVKDKLGNIAIYETINITKIDKDAPTITSVTGNPTNWKKNNVTLTVTASDELSGIAETNGYSFDGGNTWQTENTKTYSKNEAGITIKVKDKLGNITTYETINITKIDKEAPIITSVTGNPTSWTKNNVTLTVTASDELSGIAEKNGYSFDGGKTWQTENTKTYSKNEVGIKVQVKDKAGNITEYETINITKIDNEGPKVQIKTEDIEEINKIKVIINSDEVMKNIDKLNLSSKTYIESCQISEEEKELIIIYVNNKEEDMKIEDKFEVEDHLGNKTIVDLSKENIIIKAIKEEKKGDINGDKMIDVADLLLIKRHIIAGEKENWILKGENLNSADIDRNGIVNISDLLYLKRIILNINMQ